MRTYCAKTALFLRFQILDAKFRENPLALFVEYLFLFIECMGIHVQVLVQSVLVQIPPAQTVHDIRLCRR